VVVLGEVVARGAGGALRQPTVWSWKLSEGLVVECRVDSSVRAAREALGEAQAVEDLLREYIAAFNRREAEGMVVLTDPAVVSYPAAIARIRRKYVSHQIVEGREYLSEENMLRDLGHLP